MTEETTTYGAEYPTGFVLDYWTSNPEQCIIKIQGTLKGKTVKLKGLVNINQGAEIHFDDSAKLEDGDSVWCEPDGLVVLRAGATDEQIEPINDMKVQIGVYFDKTFLAHATVEP